MNSKRLNYGFSLVAVLIASAILGVLAIALSSMLTNSFKGQNTISANSALDDHLALISLLLKSPAACQSALGSAFGIGLTYSETTGLNNLSIFEPKLAAGGVYVPGTQLLAAHDYMAPRVSGKFDEVSLLTPKTKTVVGTGFEFITSLHLTLERTAGTTVGSQKKSREIPIVIVTDNALKITECHTIGDNSTPASAGPPNCSPAPFDDRPWIRTKILCNISCNGITKIPLDLGYIRNGKVVYRDMFQGSGPIVLQYDATSGDFDSISGDCSGGIAASCKQNLKEVAELDDNKCN